jgi:hypothetical protein
MWWGMVDEDDIGGLFGNGGRSTSEMAGRRQRRNSSIEAAAEKV